MALHRRPQLLLTLVLLTILLCLVWRPFKLNVAQRGILSGHTVNIYSKLEPHPSVRTSQPPRHFSLQQTLCHYGVCNLDTGTLIKHARVNIDVEEAAGFETPLLQSVGNTLPALRLLNTTKELHEIHLSMCKLKVKIPTRTAAESAADLLFGVATSIDRLEASLDQFSHWASSSGANIVALISECSQQGIDRTLERASRLGLNLTIHISDLAYDDRYFHLVTFIYEHYIGPSSAWLALIDDDTFFPSLRKIRSMLAKYPSPMTKSYYIGSISEDLHQVTKHRIFGYGGGGIFISIGLLTQLYPRLYSCANSSEQGDARLARCIATYANTKLTIEPLLHQLDVWGDPSGFYEALRPQPLSFHHWKSWHRLDMVNASKVSFICGDTCIFQKYRFADGWQLSNGFSIVKYSASYQQNENDTRMEKTFGESANGQEHAYMHSLEPLRPKDEGKIQYLLEGAILEDGLVRQFYVRRTGPDENGKAQDIAIIEVVWSTKKKRSLLDFLW